MAEKYTTLESIESKQKHKIPDNIWETDCKYCRFRQTEENFEYGSRGRYNQPCAISRFNGKCGIWDSESKARETRKRKTGERKKEKITGCYKTKNKENGGNKC